MSRMQLDTCDSVINFFYLCICSPSDQSQRRPALVQNQRRKVETDAHQLHQRAALPAGEGVRTAAVHGRLGEVPPGFGPPAHRSSGKKRLKYKNQSEA